MNKLNHANEADTLVARYNIEKPKTKAETKPYAEALHRIHHDSVDKREMLKVIDTLSQHIDPRYARLKDINGLTWAFVLMNGELHTNYLVSDTGIVFSNTSRGGDVIAPCVDSGGYLYATLRLNGKNKVARFHRLVAEAHLGADFKHNRKQSSQALTVDHKYNCKIDNRLANLQVMTHGENASKGRQIAVTLQSRATGDLLHANSMTAMARLIGSTKSNVSRLLSGGHKTLKGYQLPVTH
ncbi:hypothetical protein AB4137_02955 [Vibrio breoganii]